eukprot:scpid38483/ scgid6773/ 
MDEEALEKQALEELLRESDRAKARADLVGPSGWAKPSLPKTNKRFLSNTLLSTLSSRRHADLAACKRRAATNSKAKESREEKLPIDRTTPADTKSSPDLSVRTHDKSKKSRMPSGQKKVSAAEENP